MKSEPYFALANATVTAHIDSVASNFYHPFVHELLSALTTNNFDDLFNYYRNDVTDKQDAFGAYLDVGGNPSYNELKTAYSIYNWEAAFHAPMLLVDRLVNARQFEQALNMCHEVLSPFTAGDPTDGMRFWQFWPFRQINPLNVLENLFLSLQPGQPNSAVNEWRDKPFQPHVVARGRPAAYMKWVAMTYIRILIAWGDYLFQQDTIETINQATQLYVLAAHVYGPRGQKIPKRGKVPAETYNSLLDKWDAFGNAMVELELAFPFSNQTPFPVGGSSGVVGLANVFGFATTLYFGIPDNPDLTALRNTIDDRLFKIRHCENIAGVFRQLPLFEPPIDPGLLVQAAAQGLSLSSVLNDLNSPMPNYRFYFLLQKAMEVCTELKALGSAFLSIKEKGDGEAQSRLRATHESGIQNLVMEVRKQQLDESQKSLDALQQSRKGPVYRLQHHIKLIGEDIAKVPDEDTDFGELQDQIEQPVDESGLKLIHYEKEEMDQASAAADWQTGIGVVETLASVLHVIPSLGTYVMPFGCGVKAEWGGSNLGNAAQAVARGLRIYADHLSYQSSSAGRKAGFLRQLQDRVQQANVAGYEIKSIDKQILTQKIRINITNQEITNQQKQIDNAKEVEDFLRTKYTNQELYAWMESQVRALYYQAYTLAYDLAKKAEKVFRFERGLQDSNFIQFGYWDPAYDGLFAGERLYIGLKQLEAAYQEKRGYDFEIVKNISLQQLNPLALIQLRENGQCEFALPEVLFDMGYPGHYMRRIKTVALTFACIVGPPTSVNCVLRLLEHKFRTDPRATSKNDYPERTDGTEDRFNMVNVPITSIAVSTGQNDSGVFELNFRDERYIPFEGAGGISKWRLELPDTFREFDYHSITDVVMHLRYTALDGGDKLRGVAADWVKEYVKSVEELSRDEGLFAFFDLRHDFPNEWYKATQPPAGAMERVMTLGNVFERLPVFTRGAKILATDAYLFSSTATLPTISLNDTFPLSPNPTDVGSLPMSNWQLNIKDVVTPLDQLWLVARYTLG
jgi:receptor-binding and translocation channel-forming TcA subunit of Tc toxin